MTTIKITTLYNDGEKVITYHQSIHKLDINNIPEYLINHILTMEYIYGFSMTYEIVKDKKR